MQLTLPFQEVRALPASQALMATKIFNPHVRMALSETVPGMLGTYDTYHVLITLMSVRFGSLAVLQLHEYVLSLMQYYVPPTVRLQSHRT